MEEALYVVDGWDGDTEYFHNEENAKKEFEKRLEGFDCERITTEEEEQEGFECYRLWDDALKSWYFLTFERVKFSD